MCLSAIHVKFPKKRKSFSLKTNLIFQAERQKGVTEFGEGVDRMFREMKEANLPEPVYYPVEFMLKASLWNVAKLEEEVTVPPTVESIEEKLLNYCFEPKTRKEIMEYLGLADKNHFLLSYIRPLIANGKLNLTIPDKPNSSKQK